MISYALSDEHQELRQTVAAFARDVVRPVIGGYYERAEFPYDLIARMAKLGLFGLPFPAWCGRADGWASRPGPTFSLRGGGGAGRGGSWGAPRPGGRAGGGTATCSP